MSPELESIFITWKSWNGLLKNLKDGLWTLCGDFWGRMNVSIQFSSYTGLSKSTLIGISLSENGPSKYISLKVSSASHLLRKEKIDNPLSSHFWFYLFTFLLRLIKGKSNWRSFSSLVVSLGTWDSFVSCTRVHSKFYSVGICRTSPKIYSNVITHDWFPTLILSPDSSKWQKTSAYVRHMSSIIMSNIFSALLLLGLLFNRLRFLIIPVLRDSDFKKKKSISPCSRLGWVK